MSADLGYLLVRVQLKTDTAPRFSEIMSHLAPVLERSGWRLLGAYETRIGPLGECWHLWEVPGASGIESVLALAAEDDEMKEWGALLGEVCITEELRYLRKLPYSP
jgi:hypothetical protein